MFRLKESLSYAVANNNKLTKTALAMRIWPNSTRKSAYMNFLNLEKGVTKTISMEQITTICEVCGVSADYLFGITDIPSYKEQNNNVRDIALELIRTIQTI